MPVRAGLVSNPKRVGLLHAIRAARSSSYTKYDYIVGENDYIKFATEGEVRERCACFFSEPMKELDAWAKEVPKGYYVPRKEGLHFTTDRSTLDLTPNPSILIHC
jgi:hypothetical protein